MSRTWPAEAPPDQATGAVLKNTFSPVVAIRALRGAVHGLSLADAKPLMPRLPGEAVG